MNQNATGQDVGDVAAAIQAKVRFCHSMAEVRESIDALDGQIVALIAERGGYVAQAARLKQRADQVHDSARIEFIVDRVVAQARESGVPPAVLEATYRAMIDAFIAFEHEEFRRLRDQPGKQPGATA
ncbi:MAG: chorismate mutase [Comamonadaceae bacterium]|nr:MAG: chorismate mutase [Comamonadaceae bacterium]